jgi:hypothetical protein
MAYQLLKIKWLDSEALPTLKKLYKELKGDLEKHGARINANFIMLLEANIEKCGEVTAWLKERKVDCDICSYSDFNAALKDMDSNEHKNILAWNNNKEPTKDNFEYYIFHPATACFTELSRMPIETIDISNDRCAVKTTRYSVTMQMKFKPQFYPSNKVAVSFQPEVYNTVFQEHMKEMIYATSDLVITTIFDEFCKLMDNVKDYIKLIEVENFKKWKKQSITLYFSTLLVGPNNAGKTSLVRVMQLFQRLMDDVKDFDQIKEGRTNEKTVSSAIFHGIAHNPDSLWNGGNTLNKIKIRVELYSGNAYEVTLAKVKNGKYKAQYQLHPDRPPNSFFIPNFTGLRPKEYNDNQEERRRAEQLPSLVLRTNLLPMLKNTYQKKLVVDFLQILFPEVQLHLDETDHVYLTDNSKTKLDLFDYGFGFNQCLYLLVNIFFKPDMKIIFIDEPDSHLYHKLQHSLAQMFREISSKQPFKQIICTSHSMGLIGAFNPQQIVYFGAERASSLLSNHAKYSEFRKLGFYDNLSNVKLMDIENHKNIIIVENKEDERYLCLWIRRCWGKQKAAHFMERVVFARWSGRPDAVDEGIVSKFRGVLGLEDNDRLRIFTISDRDYRSKDEIVAEESNSKKGLKKFVWRNNEVQNYVICESTIARYAELKGQVHKNEILSKVRCLLDEAQIRNLITKRTNEQRFDELTKEIPKLAAWVDAKKFLKAIWKDASYLPDYDSQEWVDQIHPESVPEDITRLLDSLEKHFQGSL